MPRNKDFGTDDQNSLGTLPVPKGTAWARGITENSENVIGGGYGVVIPDITKVIEWRESHFRVRK